MSAEEHYFKGMDCFSDDRLDDAIAEFRSAVSLEPDHADALHALAMCHYHRRDYDEAILWGGRFRDVAPRNPLAYTSLSMFYQAKGMIAEAEEMGALAQQALKGEQSKTS